MLLIKRIFLLLVVMALGAQSAAAVPLPQPTGGFGIAPARRDVVAVPATGLTPTNVVNRTQNTYRVNVFPAILTQELSGSFDFSETPRNLNDSKLVLTTSPTRFTLAPGSSEPVSLRWNLLPTGHKWIVMGVVFQGVVIGQSGPVHVVTRLLSVNFLRLPGLTNINGGFTGLYAQQFGPRVIRFTSRVRNTGDRFWAPTGGRLTIRDASGHVALSAPWSGSVVIPGAQVDFPVTVHQILPAGQYTATTTMRFGSHRRTTSTSFTLVGPNQLPTPAIAIGRFNATGEIGSPTHVTARIASTGTAPAGVTLRLFLANSQSIGRGASALATSTVSYVHLAPGRVVHLSRHLGAGLHKGSYRVIATWTDPTGAQHSLEADFTATQARSWLDSLWKFIKDNIALFIGLVVIAVVIVLAWLVRRSRDSQRQTEAELSSARAQLRMARVHGRAAAAGDRLTVRHEREPAPVQMMEPPSPEPEQIEIVQPLEPRRDEAPPVVATANVSATAEPAETAAPSAPPATDSDWVPPWERTKPDPPADS